MLRFLSPSTPKTGSGPKLMSPPPTEQEQRREDIVRAIAMHLVQKGFAESGIRALAESAGISDRMLIYHFGTKDALIAEALMVLATDMAAALDGLLPERPTSATHIVDSLMRAAESEEQKAVLRLWFEIIGLAIRGQEPYRTAAAGILRNWEQWLRKRLRPEQQERAVSLLAQIEGQLMLSLLRQ
jgi:AcrR family transcriptional regulator